jgi:hypothetical protein
LSKIPESVTLDIADFNSNGHLVYLYIVELENSVPIGFRLGLIWGFWFWVLLCLYCLVLYIYLVFEAPEEPRHTS